MQPHHLQHNAIEVQPIVQQPSSTDNKPPSEMYEDLVHMEEQNVEKMVKYADRIRCHSIVYFGSLASACLLGGIATGLCVANSNIAGGVLYSASGLCAVPGIVSNVCGEKFLKRFNKASIEDVKLNRAIYDVETGQASISM